MINPDDWLELDPWQRQVIRELTSIRIAAWILVAILIIAPIALVVAALMGV